MAAVTAVAVLFVPPVRAQVDDARVPRIRLFAPSRAPAGQIVLRARITTFGPLLVATLYWRYPGAPEWNPAPLDGSHSLYQTTLSADHDFEYYAEAFDDAGDPPGYAGTQAAPHRMTVFGLEKMRPFPPANRKRSRLPAPPPITSPTRPRPGQRPPSGPPRRRTTPPRTPPRQARPPVPGPPSAFELWFTRPPAPLRQSTVGRVPTALPLRAGHGEVALSGAFQETSDFLVKEGTVAGGAGAVTLRYGLLRYLELDATAAGQGSTLTLGSFSESGMAFTGSAVALRAVLPELGRWYFAVEGSLGLPTIDFSALTVSPAAEVCATWDGPRLKLHASAGYRWDNSQRLLGGQWGSFIPFALGLSRYDDLAVGAAVELPLGPAVPFVEYAADVPVDRLHFARCAGSASRCPTAPPLFPASARTLPQRAGAGIRLDFSTAVALDVGAELSLTPAARNLSDASTRVEPMPEGLAPPPPLSAWASLLVQFGGSAPAPMNPARAQPANSSATAVKKRKPTPTTPSKASTAHPALVPLAAPEATP